LSSSLTKGTHKAGRIFHPCCRWRTATKHKPRWQHWRCHNKRRCSNKNSAQTQTAVGYY